MANVSTDLAEGFRLHQAGNLAAAEQHYRRHLQVEPDSVDTWFLLGTLCVGLGRFAEGVEWLSRTVARRPESCEAHCNLGAALARLGRYAEAVDAFRAALQLRPDFVDAHSNLGAALAKLGRFDEAVVCYGEALRLNPRHAETRNNLGSALFRQARYAEAIPHFEEALRHQPRFVDALNNLGQSLLKLGQGDAALTVFQRLLAVRPDHVEGYAGMGLALRRQGKHEEALRWIDESLRRKPDGAEALSARGIVLMDLCRLDEARAATEAALRQRPDSPEVLSTLGGVLVLRGELDAAEPVLREALRLRPNYPEAHLNLAPVLFLRGDWEAAWEEYEWRFRCREVGGRTFDRPLWDGAPLGGRTILLHAEQGLGDTLQFVRYAALVQERGARVILECQPALTRLLGRTPGIDVLVPTGSPLPAFDVHCPLLTVPRLLGTRPDTVPAPVPYLFAEPDLVERWRTELAAYPGRKIGVAWQGNPKYRSDRLRSFPLRLLEPLARVPGVTLFSLQKGYGAEQLREVAGRFPIVDLAPQLDEGTAPFLDTAAVLMGLDLVVTCDSALAHLAGGLGAPVWLPQCHPPDWRWLLEREDSPWYPTLRLFRQKEHGRWEEVFERITAGVVRSP